MLIELQNVAMTIIVSTVSQLSMDKILFSLNTLADVYSVSSLDFIFMVFRKYEFVYFELI